jgi:hypothetical protein
VIREWFTAAVTSFEVSPTEAGNAFVEVYERRGQYYASLPHQCDSWEIAEGTPDEVAAGLRQMADALVRAAIATGGTA